MPAHVFSMPGEVDRIIDGELFRRLPLPVIRRASPSEDLVAVSRSESRLSLTKRDPATCQALTATVGVEEEVVSVKGMVTEATGLTSVYCGGSDSSEGVLAVADRLQVPKVDAPAIATQMVKSHSFGYRSDEVLVRKTVRQVSPSPAHHDCVAPLAFRESGVPTARWENHNLIDKSDEGRFSSPGVFRCAQGVG